MNVQKLASSILTNTQKLGVSSMHFVSQVVLCWGRTWVYMFSPIDRENFSRDLSLRIAVIGFTLVFYQRLQTICRSLKKQSITPVPKNIGWNPFVWTPATPESKTSIRVKNPSISIELTECVTKSLNIKSLSDYKGVYILGSAHHDLAPNSTPIVEEEIRMYQQIGLEEKYTYLHRSFSDSEVPLLTLQFSHPLSSHSLYCVQDYYNCYLASYLIAEKEPQELIEAGGEDLEKFHAFVRAQPKVQNASFAKWIGEKSPEKQEELRTHMVKFMLKATRARFITNGQINRYGKLLRDTTGPLISGRFPKDCDKYWDSMMTIKEDETFPEERSIQFEGINGYGAILENIRNELITEFPTIVV